MNTIPIPREILRQATLGSIGRQHKRHMHTLRIVLLSVLGLLLAVVLLGHGNASAANVTKAAKHSVASPAGLSGATRAVTPAGIAGGDVNRSSVLHLQPGQGRPGLALSSATSS